MQVKQSDTPKPIRELPPEDLELVTAGRSDPYAAFKFRMTFPTKIV